MICVRAGTQMVTCGAHGFRSSLIGLACIVSQMVRSISHRIFRLLDLGTDDVEEIGTTTGMMVFLLLFQSNITRIDLDRRRIALLKALGLLIINLVHFIHKSLEPQLLKIAMQTMTTRMAFNQTDGTPADQNNENKEHR